MQYHPPPPASLVPAHASATVITGCAALIDPAKVKERGALIFVEVHLDRTTGDVFDAFAGEQYAAVGAGAAWSRAASAI